MLAAYKARYEEVAQTLSREMGAPISLAWNAQAAIGVGHPTQMIATLRDYHFDEIPGCGLLSPSTFDGCSFRLPVLN